MRVGGGMERGNAESTDAVLTYARTTDRIAVSLFIVILVEFDK